MDIRQWLDETVQFHLDPKLPEQSGFDPSNYPGKPGPVSRGRHGRKPSKSDSSLLDPPALREKTPTKKKRRPPTENSTDQSAESDALHATHTVSPGSSISSQRYARRPRRKTRPERYEPSSKAVEERGKHAYRGRNGESTRSRHKSKRKKGEKPCSGIVQSFHAKNVSGDRLTLKPREQLGLFNKGKTSMAVKGRGCMLLLVLPDLVFSEMKFLQQHKDQPEPTPQAGVLEKRRKSDHAHMKEGEISAFFTSVRPALAERDDNTQMNGGRHSLDTPLEASRPEREPSLVGDVATPTIPTVDMPDKASYLGSGGRGLRHESTSVMSWSESSAPRRTNGTSERFVLSSTAPSLHRVSRSQSYPQHTSSPRRVNLVGRAAKFQSTDSVDSPSSMPSVLPVRVSVDAQQVRNTPSSKATSRSGTNSFSNHRQPAVNGEENIAGVDPPASSGFGRLLRQCNSTVYESRQIVSPHRRQTVRNAPSSSPFVYKVEGQTSMDRCYTSPRVPTVRFAGIESRAPPLASFAGPSIYEQQAQRLQRTEERNLLDDFDVIEQDYLDGDGDMGYANQSWEGLPEEPRCHEGVVSEGAERHLVLGNTVVAPGFWRPNRLY
ncbi:uncharacterized protein K460DRAFT_297270 [Cucurbitaria berberidis CBS 394.84]|uniref:Uncharacterized protein n=1 Tax=Cucurbitaria berberidis CBS 394.84 TaxID=1168544 RepID=A0A9P4G6L1_9PLEO|nr:uncharacterized protein K460DRAFT_297270 [Cucurbitaria berberidis CBS 394.84]KAF1839954.1 hypothetical protein K460DRAFT_297270 [Cucurbitaria berberidis CBS 394.84]